MDAKMKAMALLKYSNPILAELCEKIQKAVELIVQEARASEKNGAAFVSKDVLDQFGIDPIRDLLVTDAIVDLLGAQAMGFSFDTEMDSYHFTFQHITDQTAPEGSFEYGGWHFAPFRKFAVEDGDFFKITRSLTSNFHMGLCTYEQRKKFDYSPADFYAASTDKNCDIFRCVEDGLLYVPCGNELFIYSEPEHTAALADEDAEEADQER